MSTLGETAGETAGKTPVVRFGKDHWSLLAYVEHCCVNSRDGIGAIDYRRVRCNPARHPTQCGVYSQDIPWKVSFSTRLAGFGAFPEHADTQAAIAAGLQVQDHDDWDCLEDLEAAGYIEVVSMANGRISMTSRGNAIAAQLRSHKTSGGLFGTFKPATFSQPDKKELKCCQY